MSYSGYATISVTAANASICTNYATTGSAPRWTTLGTMTISEGNKADMGNTYGSWSVTLVLAPPTGWQFNSAVNPTLFFTTARNITSVTRGTFTSTALTIVIAGTGKSLTDNFTITGLQVQATSTSASNGNIHPSSITGTFSGVSTTKNFGTLTRTTATTGTASVSISASPSGAICSGTNVAFTATPTNGGTAPTYQWKKNGTNITGATNSTYSSTALANGDAIVCGLISNTCITSAAATSGTITMTVNATPNIANYSSLTATSPCFGTGSAVTVNSTTLGSGTFIATYNLSGANSGVGFTDTLTMGSSSGTFPIKSYILDTAGATTVTVNSLGILGGCTIVIPDSNVAAFTINTLPTAVTASGAGAYCGSATITASNGSSGTIYYQGATSGGTSTATPSTSQSVSVSDTFFFRAQSSAGCWGTEGSVIVTVNPLPATVTASGGGAFCGSATITASNGGSGTIYYEGTTSGGTSIANPSASQTVSSSGTYYFRAQSVAGCWGTEGSVTVTINPLPAAITGTLSVCVGGTTSLSDATGGGTWSSSNTGIGTVGSTGIVTGLAAGTTNITYTLGTGCIATTTVTVKTTPATISGATSVCSGQSITYTDATSYGLWTSSNTGIASVGSTTGVVTGVANGSATITYSTGCGTAATKTVTVGNSPITGTMTVCSGATTTLSDALSGGTWTSGSTGIATVGSTTGLVTGVSGGTATISYVNGGCTSIAIVTVNITPASVTGTGSACVGLTATLSDGTPYGTWSSSNTGIATVASLTGVVTGVAAGTATISYATGCGTAATKTFTVNALPSSISGTTNVCVGLTTTLSDAGGGTWSSSNTGIATIGSTGIVTGVAAGTCTITYTLATGCLMTTGFTVNALPSSITGTAAVCTGSTTTLSDGTGGGAWSSSNTGVAGIGTGTGVVTGVASGTATVTYTLSTGCITTKVVTVNPLPSSISGTATACVGLTTTLSDAGGGTWVSSNPARATIGSSTGIVTGIVSGNAKITYTLATGCTTTTNVTINPLPSAISGTAVVCAGATTTLSDAGSGTWSSSSGSIATVGTSSGVVTGVLAGNTTITYTLPTSCVITTPLTVNPLPYAGTITGATTFCEASAAILSDAVTGGVWSANDTTIAIIDGTGNATGMGGGTTTITYTYTNSCGSAYTTIPVTVNPLPSVDTIAGPLALCEGSTISLTNSVSGGIWTSDITSVATIGSGTGVVTGVYAGTTLISYTLTNGCGMDFDSSTITIYAAPVPITGTFNVCVGGTTTLVNSSGGGTWSSSNTAIATIGSTGIVTGVSAGTATISYIFTATGCYAIQTVTVNTTPSTITGTARICGTASSTLSSSPSGGTWSSSATSIATVGSSSGAVTGVASGTSTITYQLSTGCRNTTPVTVNAAPSLSSATNSSPICAGVTLTLTANSPSNVTAYLWSGPVAITSSTSATATVPAATTSASGTYTVTVSNGTGAGCSVNYTTTATVNATPTASPTNSGPICAGGTVTLTANPGGSTNTYTWSGSNLSSTTAQNPVATPTVTSTYSLTVSYGTGYSGCSPATVYTTTVTVNAAPTASPTNSGPIYAGGTVTLTANPAGGASAYTWSGANLSSATVQNPTATPTVTTTYSLTVTNGTGYSGCSPGTVYTTIVTVNPAPTTYYSGATGALNLTTSWWSARNGTGINPPNFTTAGITFQVINNTAPTLTGAWTVSGTGSSVMLGDSSTAINFTIPSSYALTGTINISNNSTLTLQNSTVPALGTLAANSTVNYSGSVSYTLPVTTFGNLTVSTSGNVSFTNGTTIVAGNYIQTSGAVTLSSTNSLFNLNILGNCTLSGGAMDLNANTTATYNSYLNLSQNLTLSGSFLLQTTGVGGLNGIIDFDGAGTSSSPQVFTVSNGGTLPWLNITINSGTYVQLTGTSSAITLNGWTAGTPDWRGTVTVNGTLDTKTTSFAATAANCVFTVNSGATLITANANGLGGSSNGVVQSANWTTSFSGGANYIFNGTSAQITGTYLPASITSGGDVTINNSAGVTLSQATTFGSGDTLNLKSGTFTNGTNLAMNSGSAIICDNGSLSATPATYSGVALVYANLGVNATTVTTGNEFPTSLTGSVNVVVNKTGATITLNNAKAVSGNITLTAGTLDASTSNYNISLTGNWTNNSGTSAFTPRSGTVIFSGSSAQTIGGSFGTAFNALTINNSAGVTLSTATTFSSGATLNLQNGAFTNGSSLSMSSGSNLVQDNGTLSATPSTYSGVNLSYANLGNNALTVTTGNEFPASFAGSVAINKTGATITLNGAKTLTGSLTLTAGTLDVSTSNYSFSLSGNWTNNAGTTALTARGGTVTFNGSGAQTVNGSSGTTFNSLSVNSGSTTSMSSSGQKVTSVLKCNGTLNANGNVTLLSTSSQTALVDGSGSGTISGNVTMQRYLDTTYGYRYISSPFVAATISQLSGYISLSATFPNLYKYNENVTYAGWVIDTAVADTLKPMVGYTANFGTSFSSSTYSLTGVVNNGSLSASLYNHNQTYTLGFNLVGNPYPSPIDWSASSGWTKTNIDNAIYYFDAGDTNRYYGTYSSFVGGISSNGVANNIIPAMQGFFVHVSNGTYPVSGTLGFSNAVRVTTINPFYHKQTASTDKPLIRLDAGFQAGNKRTDAMVIYFDDQATGQFDNNLDALKLMNTDIEVPNLYSVSPDQRILSIQAVMPAADSFTIVPLGLSTGRDGLVTINTRSFENIPAGVHVWFYDTKTGVSHDIQSVPQYNINLAAGKYEGRFFLMFTNGEKIVIPPVNGELNAYTQGHNLFVYLTYGTGELVITNVGGQVIARQELSGSGFHEVTLNVSTGVYIATLYSGMGKQSKKIFIGNK